MTRVGLIGAGKMGISHYAILGAHPRVKVAAVCDSCRYVTSALRKHTGVETFKDYRKMIEAGGLDAVFVATPSATHFEAATHALEQGPARLRREAALPRPGPERRSSPSWRGRRARPTRSATTTASSAPSRRRGGSSAPGPSATSTT